MRRYNRRTLPAQWRDTSKWPATAFLVNDDDEEVVRAETLMEGINRYLSFERMGSYLKQHNITMETLLRALNRCVAPTADGGIFGWSALHMNVRTKPYERIAPMQHTDAYSRGGFAGALTSLFDDRPEIEHDLEFFCLTGKRSKGAMPESRVTDAIAHQRFKALCKEYGVTDGEWPFICRGEGKSAISKYLKRLFAEHYEQIAERQFGEVTLAKANTGRGFHDDLFDIEAYDVWQMDEHSENLMAAVEVDTPLGPAWFPCGRPQCIVVGDPALSAALGYSLTFLRQPESEDILDALSAALGENNPHQFDLEGMHHVTGGGFPSHMDSDMRGIGPAVLEVDNALVHLGLKVIKRIRDRMGCSIIFGPVKRFECRAFCESIFAWIERKILRCPTTTGTGPKDPRRRNAEEKAVKFKMCPESVRDLNETLFGKFNAKDEGENCRTVVDEIRRIMGDPKCGFLPTQLLPTTISEPKLSVSTERWKISGSLKKGNRAHIFFEYGRYEAEWLSERADLIGKEVILHIDRNCFRTMRVFKANGYFLGEVAVTGWWSKAEHTRSQRTDVQRFVRERRGRQTEDNDPMVLFFECHAKGVLEKSRGKKKKVTKSASAIAEANLRGYHAPVHPPESSSAMPGVTEKALFVPDEDDELPQGISAIN